MTGRTFMNCLRSCCCCCCCCKSSKKEQDKKEVLITGDDIQVHRNNTYEEISSKVPPVSPTTETSVSGVRNKTKNVYTDNDQLIKRKNITDEDNEYVRVDDGDNDADDSGYVSVNTDNREANLYEVNEKDIEDNLYEENGNAKYVSVNDNRNHGDEKGNLYEIMPTASLESSPLISQKQQHQQERSLKKPLGSGSDTYEVPDYDDSSMDNNMTYENTNNNCNGKSNNNNNNNNENHHYTNVTRNSLRSKLKGNFDLGKPPSIRMRKKPPSKITASSTDACLETNPTIDRIMSAGDDAEKLASKTKVSYTNSRKKTIEKPNLENTMKRIEKVNRVDANKVTKSNCDNTKRLSTSLNSVDVKKFKALFEQK